MVFKREKIIRTLKQETIALLLQEMGTDYTIYKTMPSTMSGCSNREKVEKGVKIQHILKLSLDQFIKANNWSFFAS